MTHEEMMNKWESLFTDENGEQTLAYLEISESWFPLVDTLCDQIQNHLIQTSDANIFYVVQVKEKFGGLRFYTNSHDPTIEGMIRMAEAYSYHIPQ